MPGVAARRLSHVDAAGRRMLVGPVATKAVVDVHAAEHERPASLVLGRLVHGLAAVLKFGRRSADRGRAKPRPCRGNFAQRDTFRASLAAASTRSPRKRYGLR